MITVELNKHTAEDVKIIQELQALGLSDEQIQKAYDRQQYQKGYADGINDVILQLEAEIESSDKYIREYEDTEEQRCFNQGLRAALKAVKGIGR